MSEPSFAVEACRSAECRKAIIWARTKDGRFMPVDAAPTPDGNIRLSRVQGFVRAEVVSHTVTIGSDPASTKTLMVPPAALPPPDEPLRTSHFATCLDVKRFRKEDT